MTVDGTDDDGGVTVDGSNDDGEVFGAKLGRMFGVDNG